MIFLIGAGGHAKVVYEALTLQSIAKSEIRVRADRPQKFLDMDAEAPECPSEIAEKRFHVAIGDNTARSRLAKSLFEAGGISTTVLHPRCDISSTAEIGIGCFIACGAIIATGSTVGQTTIINHAAIVDHDCVVGGRVHVAPGAVLGGGVNVGDGVLIGANSTVLPGITIGRGAIVGAGSVVTKNIPDFSVWIANSIVSRKSK